MNIALIGYGKMGQAIEQAAVRRGHKIVLRITSSNVHEMNIKRLTEADVAIEFTSPASAKNNVLQCIEAGVTVVSGTTGWNEDLQEVKKAAALHNSAFMHSSNFSIGVNILFEINRLLARLMNGRPEYNVRITESHHLQKKDAPSGTAITLAQQIIDNAGNKTKWSLNDFNDPNSVPIIAHRIGDVPGTHTISYTSSIDDIEITHTAHNREGFALGAVLAAEFINGKQGIFEMKDVLGMTEK